MLRQAEQDRLFKADRSGGNWEKLESQGSVHSG